MELPRFSPEKIRAKLSPKNIARGARGLVLIMGAGATIAAGRLHAEPLGKSADIFAEPVKIISENSGITSYDVGDLNADGINDIALTKYPDETEQRSRLKVYLGRGNLTYQLAYSTETGTLDGTCNIQYSRVVIENLNDDESPDLSLQNAPFGRSEVSDGEGNSEIYLNSGDGTYFDKVTIPEAYDSMRTAVADTLGRFKLIGALRISNPTLQSFRLNPNGQYETMPELYLRPLSLSRDLLAADTKRDGSDELFVATSEFKDPTFQNLDMLPRLESFETGPQGELTKLDDLQFDDCSDGGTLYSTETRVGREVILYYCTGQDFETTLIKELERSPEGDLKVERQFDSTKDIMPKQFVDLNADGQPDILGSCRRPDADQTRNMPVFTCWSDDISDSSLANASQVNQNEYGDIKPALIDGDKKLDLLMGHKDNLVTDPEESGIWAYLQRSTISTPTPLPSSTSTSTPIPTDTEKPTATSTATATAQKRFSRFIPFAVRNYLNR